MSGRDSKRPAGLALGLALTFAATGALAVTGQEAIAKRQENLKAIGGAFKAINDELKKDAPDTKAIAASAGKMNALSKTTFTLFPKGTGIASGAKTHAKDEIWADQAAFAAAAQGLQTETAKLQTVALTGNLDGIKAQVKATGGACKTCHTKFRAEEH
jgi:cytochrome c556